MFPRTRRLLPLLEYAAVALVIVLLSLNALSRMDYLRPATAAHVRMTDHTRTAYVARNIVEGRGYVANDMPSFLIDFYAQRGKLLEPEWTNADRFPFSAYAVAALYTITGSHSYQTGILLYNLLTFTALWLLLYWFGKSLFGSRYVPIAAIALALLHPHTWVLLYLKDADTLLLATLVMIGIWKVERAEGRPSVPTRIFAGTAMAWLFLARPNVGLPFMAFCGALTLARAWRVRREGPRRLLQRALNDYLLVGGVAVLWMVPFVIHSLAEWGSPLFSANGIYQLPLGTRFAMDSDTWWKYTEKGADLGLGAILAGDSASVLRKFTSSWPMTIKLVLGAHGAELLLASLSARLPGAAAEDPGRRARRILLYAVLAAVLLNLLTLPLFGPQQYNYRHYLAFALPALWLLAGAGVVGIAAYLEAPLRAAWDHVRRHLPFYAAGLVAIVLFWNFGARSPDANSMLARLSGLLGKHWLGFLTLLVVLLTYRQLLRVPRIAVVTVLVTGLVLLRYAPNNGIKRDNLLWLPATPDVGRALREGSGVVYSFSLQGEPAWQAGRRAVMAPENALYLYEIPREHGLVFGDVYIESARSQLEAGWFRRWAPGFETYARIERYLPPLPGYQQVFRFDDVRGYPKFRVKPMSKSSTVYRLTDRAAVEAMWRSPRSIALGDVASTIYQTHGFSGYATIEGTKVVVADQSTRARYRGAAMAPWEDTSVSFLLDTAPREVKLKLYAPGPTTLTLYWNLDLFAYDRPRDRAAHQVHRAEIREAGWTTIAIPVPAGAARVGLNKLGFRADRFYDTTLCATQQPCQDVRSEVADDAATLGSAHAQALVAAQGTEDLRTNASALLASLDFVY